MPEKQYKNMDRTSAAMAKALDKKRETQKKRKANTKRLRDKTSLSRGGFRG